MEDEIPLDEQARASLGRLVCSCCGGSQWFATGEDAFKAGWDAPPYFTQVVVCDRCPSAFVLLSEEHTGCPGPTGDG